MKQFMRFQLAAALLALAGVGTLTVVALNDSDKSPGRTAIVGLLLLLAGLGGHFRASRKKLDD